MFNTYMQITSRYAVMLFVYLLRCKEEDMFEFLLLYKCGIEVYHLSIIENYSRGFDNHSGLRQVLICRGVRCRWTL